MSEPPIKWMHVQEYDFNSWAGRFAEKEEDMLDAHGERVLDVGDSVMLVCTEPGDSFGCVVTVTAVEKSVRDGWLRYETDLPARAMEERRLRDARE